MTYPYSRVLLILITGLFLLNLNNAHAQCVTGSEADTSHPKRDLRGVFIPTLFNISWPSSSSASPAVQQAELIAILDDMKANGYNSFFFQVRPAGDAFYNSAIEPWSHWLTGTEGTAPSPFWDPLEFAITEAHARGMDLHAWLNPYRVKYGSYTTAPDHVISENPSWTFIDASNSTRTILDPGLPQVRDYIVSIVEDIATRYDVDGIHFDDYFYPSNGMTAPPNNQDAQTYIDHNPGGLSLANWRRDNVNQMIASVYDAIQTHNSTNNKNVVFGVSPFGIWKNGVPSGTTGTSSYDALYCDPIAWMQAGKVDYLAPQVYWDLNSSGQDYNLLTQWWNDQADTYNTQVYVSQAYYKMLSPQNWPASEIQGQIDFNRAASMDATFGQIAYRYNEIDVNTNGINTALNGSQFQYKSFAPPITGTGKDAICPLNPDNIRFGTLKIMWDTPAAASDGDLPEKYVVYAFNNASQASSNKNDGTKILDIVAGNELTLTQSQIDTKFLVVTSLDKNNNEAGDFCNTPLPDVTASCSVSSLSAPTAKFNCTGSYTGTTSTTFPITSTTVVTWTYDFGGGETFTQEQNVIIEDATPPTVVVQNITVTLTGSTTTITPNDIDNGSSDNCAIQSMSIDLDTFTCSDIGTHPVELTVTDNNGNTASDTAMVTVEGDPTEFTSSGWSNGAPHAGSLATISDVYSTNLGSIDACSCEITAAGTLTVEGGHYLKVDGDITVDGNLIVKHQGSVVQIDATASVIKNGSIDVELTTPPLKNRDFMILGSPMTTETRTGVFSGAYNVQAYTPANFIPHSGVPAGGTNFADDNFDDWNAASGNITPGDGFLVYPQAAYNDPAYNGPPPVSTLQFNMNYTQGTLNNGTVTRPIVFNGLGSNPDGTPNMLANPYASPINASDFVTDNALVNEVYFWEHLTAPGAGIPGANTINVSMDDISMHNGTTGLPAANDPGTSTQPNGVISTGQGFAIKAFGAGNVSFTNSMRLTSGNTTLRTPEGLETMLLKVENAQYGVRSYTGLGFRPDATPQIDANYDSDRLATMISLYSHLEDGSEQLGIQTRESFDDEIKIPMGFSSQVESETNYVISIVTIEGSVLPGVSVYLIDHRENVITDLTTDNYEFTSGQGTFDGRFTLQFEQENLLGQSYNDLSRSISIYPNPAQDLLNIRSNGFTIDALNIFDMQGRRIYNHSENGGNAIVINMSSYQSGVYFVKVDTEVGSITKKVIKK